MSDIQSNPQSKRLQAIHDQLTKGIDASYAASWAVREKAVESRRFCDIPGAQWAGWIGQQFENRYKPEINKIAKSVARIFNEYRNNRITVDFQPETEGADAKVADLFDDMHRADERDSCAQEAYDCAFQEGLKGGYGGWRLCTDYEDHEDEDNERQRIMIIPITDADSSLYFDIDARRYDKADARWGAVLRGMSKEAYEEEWPRHAVVSYEKPLPGGFTWFAPDQVYVAECYVRETYKTKVFTYKSTLTDEERRIKEDDLDDQLEDLLATGFVLDRTRTLEKRRVHKYIINGQEVIEDCGIIAGEHIPLIPYYGNRSVIDGVEQVWGLVGPGKDAQQLYNMQVGVIGEQAALGGTSKPILMPEQIVGHEYMWAYDNIQRNPYLLLNSVRDANGQPMPAGPIAFTQAPVLSQATSALIDISNRDIMDTTGNLDQGQGVVSNVSAEAMQLSQDRVDMGSFGYMDGMAKSMRRHGEVWQSMRKDIETERRKVRTLKLDGSESEEEIMVPAVDDKTGATIIKNDITKGKYKVFADVGPSFSSRRKSTQANLLELMRVTPDPQQQSLLSSAILMNSDGEGLEDIRNYTRKQLVQQGVVPPTEEEKEEMAQAQANAQPDPQSQFLLAESQKAQALALKAQADTELTKAKTAETLAGIETSKLEVIMKALDQYTSNQQAAVQQQAQSAPATDSVANGPQ